MTREEKRIQASVAYNEQHGKLRVIGGSAILSDEEFIAFNKNPDFIAGATWADENPKKGLINVDKACEWLVDNIYGYVEESQKYSDGYSIDLSSLVSDFRKAMQNG